MHNLPQSYTNTTTSKNISPIFYLARRVLLVIILNGLNSGIAVDNVVNQTSEHAKAQSLRGANDEAAKGRHGADSAGGTTRDGTGSEELGVAVDEPFGLSEELGRSEHDADDNILLW